MSPPTTPEAGAPLEGFLMALPEALLRGCRYLPFEAQIPLPGGVITVQSLASDGEELFMELAASREPFVMTLEGLDEGEGGEDAQQEVPLGVLGIASTHTLDEALGVTTTEILGVGRVRLEASYLLPGGDELPRVDVTPVLVETGGEDRETIQAALELLVDGFLEPLEHANEEFVRVLKHFARAHEDTSLNIDRVANILAERQPLLLHKLIMTPSMLDRLAILQEEMRRIHERLLARIIN